MNLLKSETYDLLTIVKIVCFYDLIQPALLIISRAWTIIFRKLALNESDQSAAVIVVLFALIICFYILHMTIALKLYTAIRLSESDPLQAARNAKMWQNWSILILVFLFGNLIASILSASTKLPVIYFTLIGICEIIWRLFGIYKVGNFIDGLVLQIPAIVPTMKFFGVRFPVAYSTFNLNQI